MIPPTTVSKCTVKPSQKSLTGEPRKLRLSVSDLPMLSCHYIQKGVVLPSLPPSAYASFNDFVSLLKKSLARTLSYFSPLAGRLYSEQTTGHVHILCNDAGVDFIHAKAKHFSIDALLDPYEDVPEAFKSFFVYENTLISYSGHLNPLVAVQVTELIDGVFIGCTVNHSVVDGTSFWHFFNTFAEITKAGAEAKVVFQFPNFTRDTVFDSSVALRVPAGGPRVTFNMNEPMRERIFHFSGDAILRLKARANKERKDDESAHSLLETEISSFQALCGLLWRSVTRARKLSQEKETTFRMAVNCRHRVEPRLSPYYFGNAIQSTPTVAKAGELLSRSLGWSSELLRQKVEAHGDAKVRTLVKTWENEPRVFPLGNFDGASITMGSSPRFPMYNNDFGWGRPLAVRSGRANKFDGKISAFPGREGGASIELETVLAPATMSALENDPEFMQYVSFHFVGFSP